MPAGRHGRQPGHTVSVQAGGAIEVPGPLDAVTQALRLPFVRLPVQGGILYVVPGAVQTVGDGGIVLRNGQRLDVAMAKSAVIAALEMA